MNSFKFYRTIAFSLFAIIFSYQNVFAADYEFELNSPYWYILFNRAGYIDITDYWSSPRHPDGPHEMCTGDIAGAAWYQNISTGNQAAWLVNHFVIPTFSPTTPFIMRNFDVFNDLYNPIWDDPCQPTDYYDPSYSGYQNGDTAWSTIDDGKLQIKIHYEAVDLGEQDANGTGGSPIAFRDVNDNPVFVYSERYILLLTYVFKNLSQTSDINGLEFSQMMHGHPTGSYPIYTNGMYETANFYDSLENYAPYDSNHQTGNFKYDITLWNSGNPETEHVDWMSFSSTLEPVAVDFNTFTGQGVGMEYNIIHRDLKGYIELAQYELAGAAKWNLGTLGTSDSNNTKKITIAIMYGCGPIQHDQPIPPGCENLTLTKTDDIEDCVYPSIEGIGGIGDSEITYDVNYSIPCEINDIKVVDTLPDGTTFVDATGTWDYNAAARTITWDLGDIDPCQIGGFTLTVRVDEEANQGSTLTNTARMYRGQDVIKTATDHTNICCLNPIAYVKWNATGANNGTSWSDAYTNLQTALSAVRNGEHICAEQIWVADGNYFPTSNPSEYTATFQMIDGIDIYGHFEGWGETSIDQRNLADANNATILSGDINSDQTSDIDIIVTAANNARLDCFTVTKGRNWSSISGAVYSDNVSATIANCIIKNNDGYGLQCRTSDSNSYVSLVNCFIEDNGQQGIYCINYSPCTGTLYLDISRCTISANNSVGLYANDNTMDVNMTDSVVSGNHNSYGGIYSSAKKLTVKNCDITDNDGYGIYAGGNAQLSVKNCVVSENSSNGIYAASSSQADIANNVIFENKNGAGICIDGGTDVNIMNNLVYKNHNYGINLSGNDNSLKITNNTIADNTYHGIYKYSYYNPSINSNIIWGNTSGGLTGFNPTIPIYYNCIQGGWGYGEGNTDQNPQFRDSANNDYHLTTASIYCIDKGDPNFNSTEQDFDGQDRIMDGDRNNIARVDMGADELCPYDLVQDGFINFLDFAVFAKPWKTSQSDPNYNDLCDFYDDGATDYINYKDLYIFCEYWLWPTDWDDIGGQGAYFEDTGGQMQMMMSESSLAQTTLPAEQDVVFEAVAAQAEPQIAEVEPVVVDVNEILDWLDNLWETDEEVRDAIDANSWLEFIESIKSSE
jgi:uncharacterized repeat protein (TIGR01451 family)